MVFFKNHSWVLFCFSFMLIDLQILLSANEKFFVDTFKLNLSYLCSTCVPVLQRIMLLQNDLDRVLRDR